MYRTERHLRKKYDGSHNFFGEDDYIDVKDGHIEELVLLKPDQSPEPKQQDNQNQGSG